METSLTVSCLISFKCDDDAQHYLYYFVYIREMANVCTWKELYVDFMLLFFSLVNLRLMKKK